MPSRIADSPQILHAALPVEHGRFFANTDHPPSHFSLPNLTVHNAPTPPDTHTVTPAEPAGSDVIPYMAYGFIIDAPTSPVGLAEEGPRNPTRIVYLSDVSKIPERTWDTITRPVPLGLPNASRPPSAGGPSMTSKLNTSALPAPQSSTAQPIVPSLVIMDCLRPASHSSHFGLAQTYSACRRLLDPTTYRKVLLPQALPDTTSVSQHRAEAGCSRAYMVGFSHEFTAAEWGCVGDVLAGERAPSEFSNIGDAAGDSEDNWKEIDGGVRPAYVARALDALVDTIPSLTRACESSASQVELSPQVIAKEDRIWMRPGWDGLRLFLRGQEVFDYDPDHNPGGHSSMDRA